MENCARFPVDNSYSLQEAFFFMMNKMARDGWKKVNLRSGIPDMFCLSVPLAGKGAGRILIP